MKNIGSDTTKKFLADTADAVSQVVRWIINLAPFGIMGLVYTNVAGNGLAIFTQYGKLLALLVGTMLFMAFIVSPFIIFLYLRRNPYPLVFRRLKESGLTAFFTRSSAANIPSTWPCARSWASIRICIRLHPSGRYHQYGWCGYHHHHHDAGLRPTRWASRDPACRHCPERHVRSGACGASGVAGGSLLLIPMACSLFGISNDVAMQMVGVGFIIGVIQDSVETALNSAGDVEFAATAEYHQWLKQSKPLPDFLK